MTNALERHKYDVLVIGAGGAGLRAAVRDVRQRARRAAGVHRRAVRADAGHDLPDLGRRDILAFDPADRDRACLRRVRVQHRGDCLHHQRHRRDIAILR